MPDTQQTLDRMAEEIFDLYKVLAAARSRQPAGPDDLSETEYLTLDALTKDEPMTIGEIQKRVGVVAAQMSRVIRALEEAGGRGYVDCKINPLDRRRVDVYLTPAGRKAHAKFRQARLGSMFQALNALPPEDRFEFMRMLRHIRQAVESKQLSIE